MNPNGLRHWRHLLRHRWRHDRRPFVIAGVVAAVVVAGLVAVLTLPGDRDVTTGADPLPAPLPVSPLPSDDASTTPSASPSASATPSSSPGAGTGTGVGASDPFAGLPGYNPKGLGGTGGERFATPRNIVLSATSAASIYAVGFQAPTSVDRSSGVVRDAGPRWGVTTTVYGRPDYARLFAQAGPTGAPVTCTITVDGKVRDRRTTQGPYGMVICQG